MFSEMGEQTGKELVLAEAIVIPLTLVLLLVVFGSVVAALLPLVIGIIAVVGAFAHCSACRRGPARTTRAAVRGRTWMSLEPRACRGLRAQ
ncbi:MMPL family transporter [Streptodolium elevatio]|uniref:MMPL family transporter n=1 Tax=Streptodolium elevatio TaxID=3157996 RepID=A0ABV3DJQ0_9ACTN